MNERSSEPTSPRPRRIATPSWLDVRLIVGIVLVLGSVLAGAKIVSSANKTYAAVAARRDLEAGTILTENDLTVARVQLPGHGAGVYLSRIDAAVGRQLSRPVSAGELLPGAALDSLPARTTVTVPLGAGNAPDLHKGERIELWVSSSTCSSLVLLPDVTVQAVRADTAGSFGAADDGQDVVISVAPDLADRVVEALALDQAQLRAGVLVGAGAAARQGAAEPLPDLDSCPPSSK